MKLFRSSITLNWISIFSSWALDIIILCSWIPLLAASVETPITFIYFADWGHNVPAAQSGSGVDFEEQKVADQVTNYTKLFKPNFYIAGGDNFYDNGVTSVTDPLWDKYYRNVWTDPATVLPWYVIFGNHDYTKPGLPQAQIDYYKQGIDARWTFPDYQYTKIWNIPGTRRTLQIVFINTVALCPEARSGDIGWPVNPSTSYPSIDSTAARLNQLIRQPTLQWIENQLKSSSATYLIVAGHYHFFTSTSGRLYTPEAACLQANLLPLFYKYGVELYINGHAHNFDNWLVNGTNFLTVGHGSDRTDYQSSQFPNGPLPATVPDPSKLLFQRTVGGFAIFNVSRTSINWQYIDESGNVIWENSVAFSAARKARRGKQLNY